MILAVGDVTNDLLDFKFLGGLTYHQTLLVVCSLLMLVVFIVASRRVASTAAPGRNGPVALLEVGLVWVRDEVVYPWLGPERGRKYLPYLWTLFFFVLFSNLFGLMPSLFYPGDHTDALAVATADLGVTASLAIITFLVTQFSGIKEHGAFGYFKRLIPPGVPIVMIPIVFIVEFMGLFTKPFALTVRLFANMVAGHALLAILFSFLIGVEHYAHPVIGMPETIASVGFILFIMVFETLIALVQAYIFTILTAIFISQAVSHDH